MPDASPRTSPRSLGRFPIECLPGVQPCECAARRGELTDPRSPGQAAAVSAGPTLAPGSGWRARGAPDSEAAGRAAGQSRAPSPPSAEGPAPRPRRPLPAPRAPARAPRRPRPGQGPRIEARVGAATHRTLGGSDRPSSLGCRCPPRPRCGGSGWSPWCTAGQAEDGGVGGGGGVLTRTRPGPGRTDARPRPRAHGLPEPPPPARPGARRHGSPPPPGARSTSGNGVPSSLWGPSGGVGSPTGNYTSQKVPRPGSPRLLAKALG